MNRKKKLSLAVVLECAVKHMPQNNIQYGYTLEGCKAENGHDGIVMKKNRKILTKKN